MRRQVDRHIGGMLNQQFQAVDAADVQVQRTGRLAVDFSLSVASVPVRPANGEHRLAAFVVRLVRRDAVLIFDPKRACQPFEHALQFVHNPRRRMRADPFPVTPSRRVEARSPTLLSGRTIR